MTDKNKDPLGNNDFPVDDQGIKTQQIIEICNLVLDSCHEKLTNKTNYSPQEINHLISSTHIAYSLISNVLNMEEAFYENAIDDISNMDEDLDEDDDDLDEDIDPDVDDPLNDNDDGGIDNGDPNKKK